MEWVFPKKNWLTSVSKNDPFRSQRYPRTKTIILWNRSVCRLLLLTTKHKTESVSKILVWCNELGNVIFFQTNFWPNHFWASKKNGPPRCLVPQKVRPYRAEHEKNGITSLVCLIESVCTLYQQLLLTHIQKALCFILLAHTYKNTRTLRFVRFKFRAKHALRCLYKVPHPKTRKTVSNHNTHTRRERTMAPKRTSGGGVNCTKKKK